MMRYFVTPAELERFLMQMLDTEGFAGLEADLRPGMVVTLLDQLEDDTANIIAESLTMQDASRLGAMMEGGVAPDRIQRFLCEKIPNFRWRLTSLLSVFRDYYVQESERPTIRLPTIT